MSYRESSTTTSYHKLLHHLPLFALESLFNCGLGAQKQFIILLSEDGDEVAETTVPVRQSRRGDFGPRQPFVVRLDLRVRVSFLEGCLSSASNLRGSDTLSVEDVIPCASPTTACRLPRAC